MLSAARVGRCTPGEYVFLNPSFGILRMLLELMLFSLKIHTYCCKASFVTDMSVMMQVVKYKKNVFCVKVVELNDIYMSCHIPIYCTIGHF
jgi:hypothetical protein